MKLLRLENCFLLCFLQVEQIFKSSTVAIRNSGKECRGGRVKFAPGAGGARPSSFRTTCNKVHRGAEIRTRLMLTQKYRPVKGYVAGVVGQFEFDRV